MCGSVNEVSYRIQKLRALSTACAVYRVSMKALAAYVFSRPYVTYKEKSRDFLLMIKIFIFADTRTATFQSSTVHVYYRADNILVLCVLEPLGCMYYLAFMFVKERVYLCRYTSMCS